MITIWERIKMEPTELRIRYTEIIKKYNSHFELGDYEVAFLLSQSLFEDRLNVYWILGSWHTKSDDYWDVLKPEPNETKKVSLMSKTYNLRNWEMIGSYNLYFDYNLLKIIKFFIFSLYSYSKLSSNLYVIKYPSSFEYLFYDSIPLQFDNCGQ